MAINQKSSFILSKNIFYKKYTYGKKGYYEWNTYISWIRLFLILASVFTCVLNYILITIVLCIAYFFLYMFYIMKNRSLLLKLSNPSYKGKYQVIGNKYSFSNPYTIKFH